MWVGKKLFSTFFRNIFSLLSSDKIKILFFSSWRSCITQKLRYKFLYQHRHHRWVMQFALINIVVYGNNCMIQGIPGQYWLLGKKKIVASEKLDLFNTKKSENTEFDFPFFRQIHLCFPSKSQYWTYSRHENDLFHTRR